MSDLDRCQKFLARPELTARSFESHKPTIVLVGAYSSGRFLAPEFRAADHQVVHIHHQSGPLKHLYQMTYWPETHDWELGFDGNMPRLLEQLRKLNLVAVLPGSDSGVLLADQLATELVGEGFKLPSNGLEPGRKDKFIAGERLKAAGVDSVKQMKTSSTEEALDWIKREKLFETSSGLVVIKPIGEAGGNGVLFVRTEEQVKEAFNSLIGTVDSFGRWNTELLVQEYLEGPEYVVNTTSRDGKHIATDIWLYSKRFTPDGQNVVYHYDELLPFDGPEQRLLVAYNERVLTALGNRTGNDHNEIKLVPGRGPVLVEPNNRMMGSSQPRLAELATGHSQIDRTVLAYTNPEIFRKLVDGYDLNKHAFVFELALFNKRGPAVMSSKASDLIRGIKGHVYHNLNRAPGEVVHPTIDLHSALGEVWLLGDRREDLMKSIDELHRLEAESAFTVHSEVPLPSELGLAK